VLARAHIASYFETLRAYVREGSASLQLMDVGRITAGADDDGNMLGRVLSALSVLSAVLYAKAPERLTPRVAVALF
jgi:hypothetical protein